MPFCSKCGTGLEGTEKRCPTCGKAEEKYPLYAKAFRAKHTVYLARTGMV